jgi:hypothetical protein
MAVKGPDCAGTIMSAAESLQSIEARIRGEPFVGVAISISSDVECTQALTLLNGVAAEKGVANQSPLPLDAPFPFILTLKARQTI